MGLAALAERVPNAKKGTLSVWFRAPASSLAAAKAEYDAWLDHGDRFNLPPLLGIVPLLISGPPTVAKVYNATVVGVGSVQFQVWAVGTHGEFGLVTSDTFGTTTTEWSDSGVVQPRDPTYIGIDCTGDYPALSVNLVMPKDNTATFTGGGTYEKITSFSDDSIAGWYVGVIESCVLVEGGPLPPDHTLTSVASDNNARFNLTNPETFRLLPTRPNINLQDKADQNYQGQRITPNHWHHLLLSFDLTNKVETQGGFETDVFDLPCDPSTGFCGPASVTSSISKGNVSSSCKMYIALDDKNLTGSALTVHRPDGGGPNDIVTVHGYHQYKDLGLDSLEKECVIFGRRETIHTISDRPGYTFTPDKVPFAEGATACPATQTYVGQVKHVEMAELQMLIGVSIDTKIKANRRAFITDKGKPVPPKTTEKFFRKKPEVILHTAKNWQKAKNTGSLGGAKPPNGATVGDIEIYKPDPSLSGPQGKPQ